MKGITPAERAIGEVCRPIGPCSGRTPAFTEDEMEIVRPMISRGLLEVKACPHGCRHAFVTKKYDEAVYLQDVADGRVSA